MLRKKVLITCVITPFAIAFLFNAAFAIPLSSSVFLTNGGDNVSIVGNNVNVGVTSFLAAEFDTQPEQISGVSVPIGNTPGTLVKFNWALFTWDSYNALGTSPSSGYWDSFSVTLTQNHPYWDLGLTDPVVGDAQDPNIIDVATTFTFFGHGSGATEEFGGLEFADGTLESSQGPPQTFALNDPTPDPTATYFVNFILDTATSPENNGSYPSWGTFTNIDVDAAKAIPEPASIILLGVGLAGLAGYSRKKFKK